jgi:uncharacterized phiE125 gp8 family phage protein
MGIAITDPPDAEPLSLEEFKAHSRIDSDADDTYIGSLIQAAREYVESVTALQLMRAEFTVTLNRFPMDDYIDLPNGPLHEVETITYIDTAGDSQVLSDSDYEIDTGVMPGRIYIDRSVGWPTVKSQRNAVEIVYTAGWANSGEVPEKARHAIRFLAANWYENREPIGPSGMVATIPFAAEALIANLKLRGTPNSVALGLYA